MGTAIVRPRWSGRRRSSGQSMVEFALILPLFLLLVFGVLDFGRAVYADSTITNAAREGARFGMIAPSPTSAIQVKVQQYAASLAIPTSNVSVSCVTADGANDCANAQAGDQITVAVTYAFVPVVVNIGGFVDPSLTLAGQATMVVQ
jgi:Flp pilus assembly protein TadG